MTDLDPGDLPVGFERFHRKDFLNYQFNRAHALGFADRGELFAAVAHVRSMADCVPVFEELSVRAAATGRHRHAAGYLRLAEFFTPPRSPQKAERYRRLRGLYDAAFAGTGVVRDEVPYAQASLPAYRLPAAGPGTGGTVLLHGGFDSPIEEFYPLWQRIAAAGFDVVAFEGPGQGGARTLNGLASDHDWEKPVGAVLDHFGVEQTALVGLSMGGYWALRAAGREPRVHRVAEEPRSGWQDEAMNEVTDARQAKDGNGQGAGSGTGAGHRARGAVPGVAPQSWWNRLWKPFWALPAACVLISLAVGIVLPQVEQSWGTSELQYVFQGGPDGARGLLGTIASAMISVTGLVFSITMVVLQLASSQFTPRVLGGFLQNRVVQSTLGVFVSTFVFALTVTRAVRGANETEQFVPQVSVTLAFLMVLASVGFFLAFIHHITTSIQVSHVISRIGDQTVRLADKMFPEPAEAEGPAFGPTWSPAPGTPHLSLEAPRHGVITHVDYAGLVRWARERGVVVTLDRPVGQFLTEGQRMLRVWGDLAENEGREETRGLYRHVGLGPQREMRQDVAFGIRQLVDIADRALSPGVNDPTTAVQCLDELHRILRLLVRRASPSPYIADDDGRVRVVHHPQAITDLAELAVLEIAHFGRDSAQIPGRLQMLLEDVREVSAERYRPTVERLLETRKGDDDVV